LDSARPAAAALSTRAARPRAPTRPPRPAATTAWDIAVRRRCVQMAVEGVARSASASCLSDGSSLCAAATASSSAV
jgi:hypothetical protein